MGGSRAVRDAVSLAAFALASCGGGGTSSAPSAPAAVAPLPTPAPSPIPAAIANTTTANLAEWTAARARVKDGTGRAKIAIVGDSTVTGLGAGPSVYGNARLQGWPALLALALQSRGLPARASSFFGDGGLQGHLPEGDPRLTLEDGWTTGGTAVPGGYAFSNATTTTALTFAAGTPSDRADIYDLPETFTAPMSLSLNGAPVSVLASPTTGAPRKTSVSFLLTDAPMLSLAAETNGGTVQGTRLVGMDVYDSAHPDVAVWNLGIAGSTSDMWLPAIQQLGLLDPDLTIICLGINDLAHGVTAADYKRNIKTLAQAAKANGDVVLMVPNRFSIADAPQLAYEKALYELSDELGLPLVRVPTILGELGTEMQSGYIISDGVHPSGRGYQLIANTVADLLLK